MFIRSLMSAAIVAAGVSCAWAGDISGVAPIFPYPIYAKWADTYKTDTGNGLNYQSIGSRHIGTPPRNPLISLHLSVRRRAIRK